MSRQDQQDTSGARHNLTRQIPPSETRTTLSHQEINPHDHQHPVPDFFPIDPIIIGAAAQRGVNGTQNTSFMNQFSLAEPSGDAFLSMNAGHNQSPSEVDERLQEALRAVAEQSEPRNSIPREPGGQNQSQTRLTSAPNSAVTAASQLQRTPSVGVGSENELVRIYKEYQHREISDVADELRLATRDDNTAVMIKTKQAFTLLW